MENLTKWLIEHPGLTVKFKYDNFEAGRIVAPHFKITMSYQDLHTNKKVKCDYILSLEMVMAGRDENDKLLNIILNRMVKSMETEFFVETGKQIKL